MKPASPHLHGKVERSQKTDLEEFYATADYKRLRGTEKRIRVWQFYYNWQRPHGALRGKTPSQVDSELADKTPLQEEVSAMYNPSKEHIQEPNYYLEMKLRELKLCL